MTTKNDPVYFRAVELALSIPQDPVNGMPVPDRTDTLRIGMELEVAPDDPTLTTIPANLVSTEADSDEGHHHIVVTREGAKSRKFYLISKNKVKYPD